MPRAFLTDIMGQDGAFLRALLLERGHELHGIKRCSSSINRARIDHLGVCEHGPENRLFLYGDDLADSVALVKLLYEIERAEVVLLIGSYDKAKANLGWEPQTRMHALAALMVDSGVKLARQQTAAAGAAN